MSSRRIQDIYTSDDFTRGLVDDIAVSDSLAPKNSVRKAVNVRFDRPRGAVSQRYGTTAIGSVIVASNIKGLHNFRAATTAATSRLIASVAGTLQYWNGTTWVSSHSGFEATAKSRFITYVDRVAHLNGVDAVRTWEGIAGWVASGTNLDEGNWPITRYAALLNGRMCAAGNTTLPSRLYQSSIVSTAGAISWTSGNRNVDVYPNDGNGAITSIHSNGRVILIFKERGFYRYDDNELQRIVGIGTPSHESVFTDDNGVTYFFGQGANSVGIYATNGGFPRKISRPIQKWIDAISASSYGDVAGFTDGSKCVWSVGNVTVDDIAYSNVCLVYVISDQTWTVEAYADSFKVFASYINTASSLVVVGGDSDGNVQTISSGNTDNGTAINSECEFAPVVLGKRGETKTIEEIVTFARDCQGLNLLMAADEGRFEAIGGIDKRVKQFKAFPKLKGHLFYPKITCANSGTPFVFEGFEINYAITEGYSML